jgi:hypothetical protein
MTGTALSERLYKDLDVIKFHRIDESANLLWEIRSLVDKGHFSDLGALRHWLTGRIEEAHVLRTNAFNDVTEPTVTSE